MQSNMAVNEITLQPSVEINMQGFSLQMTNPCIKNAQYKHLVSTLLHNLTSL